MVLLSDREKVAHLLRRFGLGASHEEVEAFAKVGVEATLGYLLNYESQDEGFNVSPWEACFEEGKDEIYLDPYRSAAWWSLRMVMTKRPLQEKLTLFWHNHFAISGSKVEIGPMLIDYLEVMRKHGSGKFDDLLLSVSKTPAMITWLDTLQNQKGHPNENFAREIMELFTLGIGNYTEKDVQEAARAFTGWGIRYLILEQGGDKVQETAKAAAMTGRPLTVFANSPDLHDDGEKTILGQTKNWGPDDLIAMLASRPETAKLIATKLWSFFAYQNPEPAVVDRLAKVYLDGGHQIKPMLLAIAQSPEFWSEKCVRQQVKSPVDFTFTIARQLGLGVFLSALHKPQSSPTKPMEKPLRDIAGLVWGLSYQQGMMLLFPPDVSGWKWGTAWISTEAMGKRASFGPMLMGMESKDHGGAGALLARMLTLGKPANSEQATEQLLRVFDADLPADKKALIAKACDSAGGAATFTGADAAAPALAAMCKLLFSSPEFQFC